MPYNMGLNRQGWGMRRDCDSAWFTCMRSGIRVDLNLAVWEQGKLVHPDFSDLLAGGRFGLLGSREADIAQRIRMNTSDLQPHPKLSEPDAPDEDVYL